MEYNTILQLLAALTNVVGTTYAVLSILKITPHELYQAITIEGMDRADKSLLIQKKQARIGICLVIYAWVLQVIFTFLKVSSWKMFAGVVIAYLMMTGLLILVVCLRNKRFEKGYDDHREKMEKEKNESHSDAHTIVEF